MKGAAGLGNLLARQLVAAGERVVDVPPKLAARVRLLASRNSSKNDPNDSVAVAALRSKAWPPVAAEDHAVVLKIWANRHRHLARVRNQACCRLHAVLCDLVPGGIRREISAGKAARILEQVTPADPAAQARCELAAEFLADLRRRGGLPTGTPAAGRPRPRLRHFRFGKVTGGGGGGKEALHACVVDEAAVAREAPKEKGHI